MTYVQGSSIDKVFVGSFEHKALVIKEALSKHLEKDINVLAVHPDHSIFVDEDGNFNEAKYQFDGEKVEGIEISPSKKIPVIQDEDILVFVAKTLKEIVESMCIDGDAKRTQVREVMQLISRDEDYWLGDVITKLEECGKGAKWNLMYEANKEDIRTALYGSIREIEGQVPKTRYSKIPKSKLHEFEGELRESLSAVRGVAKKIVDEASKMVFDKENEFFGAIQSSLIVEAQAIQGLLGKAEKLMRKEDVFRVSMAHDGLAERAKIMAIVTEHLKGRAQRQE